MDVLVQLVDGESRRFIDEVHASARPGGNRTYYEWVRHSYQVHEDRTLSIVERTDESWYHFSGEHRDMRVLRERPVVVYSASQWLNVGEA